MLTPQQPMTPESMALVLDAGAILVSRPAERGLDVVSTDRKVFDDEGRLVAILPEQVDKDSKYVHHVRHYVVSDTYVEPLQVGGRHRPAWKYGQAR